MEIFRTASGGPYAWAEIRIYEHPAVQGKYALSYQRGCSCSGFEEPNPRELTALAPLTGLGAQRELIRALQDTDFSRTQTLDALERFLNLAAQGEA